MKTPGFLAEIRRRILSPQFFEFTVKLSLILIPLINSVQDLEKQRRNITNTIIHPLLKLAEMALEQMILVAESSENYKYNNLCKSASLKIPVA